MELEQNKISVYLFREKILMISVTKLLFAREYYGDSLRYTKNAHSARNGAGEGMGPVVVWNSTISEALKPSAFLKRTLILVS